MIKRFLLFSLTALFLFSSPLTFAEDVKEDRAEETEEPDEKPPEKPLEKSKGYYAPELCDFEVTFPEKPLATKRCPKNLKKCYQVVSYTFVYDLSTTVEVSANCAPSSAANYKRYSKDIMEAALRGMAQRADLTSANVSTIEKENFRQSSLIGTGSYGRESRIYNAQIWVGKNSILTVEGKLTGKAHAEADKIFGDILASMKVKDTPKD